jgi:hypothetical protein
VCKEFVAKQRRKQTNTEKSDEKLKETVKLLEEVTTRYERSVKMHAITTELLNEYKNLEEQGLLVRLPCKVGDEVYIICKGKFINTGKFQISDYDNFDKTVFLTREEAENKLNEMEA